jgi:hypothetical protein
VSDLTEGQKLIRFIKPDETVVEVGDPGVSGKLTSVTTDDGKTIYIREDMDVAEAMAFGQAALDAKDARLMTTTIRGRRFPTYESNPVITRETNESFTKLRAEVELALHGNKTADVQAVRSDDAQNGVRVEVTKSIREKHPIQFNIRLLWVRLRDRLLPTLERLRKFLRRI